MRDKEALYWSGKNGRVRCELCPHMCVLEDSQFGLCNARQNVKGLLVSKSYGLISAISIDPVEKKPLYHFYPGSKTLSFGGYGCNFKCGFCQNFSVSQIKPKNDHFLLPEDALYFALEKNIRLISYTYNEPLINYEWIFEMFVQARKRSMQNILVTNGYINEVPLKRLAEFTDAANVDLKAFNNDFYKKNCGGTLEPVLKTIELLYKEKVHIELTNLLIDGQNTDIKEFEKMIDFIASLSDAIPLHLSRYFPNYNFKDTRTKEETLKNFYNLAKEKLKYVYLGNFDNIVYESTFCKKCGNCLIARDGYEVTVNCKNPAICPECGSKNNIIL